MIIDILRHTPAWVFMLLAALVYLGLRRVRSSDVPLRRLLILPVAMTCFSLFGLWQTFGSSLVAATAWNIVFAASLVAGWTLPTDPRVQYLPASRSVRVPGSWVPLALMMTIFFLRYVVAVLLAIHPSLRFETPFVAGIAVLYGCSSGCFAARALMTWRGARNTSGDRFVAPA